MLEIYTGAEDCPKCGGTKPIKMECPWCAIKTLESERDSALMRVAAMEWMLVVSKSALEKARPVLGYHEHEPWRNEMDKQTGYAASAVRNALDRLNGLFV